MRPAYFVVIRALGREVAAIFWDELPREPIRDLVYATRLDTLPNGADLCDQNLGVLYAMFCHLRKAGKLPPQWQPPPRPAAAPAKRLEGHREVHARWHLPDAPYDPQQ